MKYHPLYLVPYIVVSVFLLSQATASAETIRARDLGIPFEGQPGPLNAIDSAEAISEDGSGDIFVGFSTANAENVDENKFTSVGAYPNNELSTVFANVVWATEEVVVNAMVAAETMIGVAGLKVEALPEDQVRALFAGVKTQ